MSVEELLSGTPKDNKSQLAERLLNEMLEDGKRLQSDILAKAKDWDISKRVLDEVKKKLGVKSTKSANKWYWELPLKE